MKSVIFDMEADGLKPTKIHCLSFFEMESSNTAETITSYSRMREFFQEYDVYIGHNIRRFDLVHLEKLLDIKITGIFIDSLAVSWYLEPKRKKNGLESYGDQYGISKPFILDWENQKLADYIHRCEQDVLINTKLWQDQLQYLTKLYPDPKNLWSFLKYLDFKMYCAMLQEQAGWRLDVTRCSNAIERLEAERDLKTSALALAMPKVPIIREYVAPKRLRNSDGQLSVLGQRWKERLDERGLPEGYDGSISEVVGYDEPNPGSHGQIKDWLYSLGWVPATIKYQRNKETGEMKEIPQVNKERGEGICESIKRLYEKEPSLELLDGLSVLSHRLSLLRGFLRDVDDEDCVRASVQGLTNTLRFKHAVVVNLPKVGVKYGDDIRGCLISSSDDHELCGADMSSLEDRIKQHYIQPHDPDYVAELNRPDYDPHLDIAVIAGGLVTNEADFYKRIDAALQDALVSASVTKEDKAEYGRIKKKRSIFKNGNYACQYGAGPPRLVITCGISLQDAKDLHKAYWKRNWAIRAVADEQTIKTLKSFDGDGEQMWLYNPVSTFWYSLRTEKDIFSTLVQGTASYCFDTWVIHVLSERPQLTAQFHDEIVLDVLKGHQEEIREFLQETIEETNEYLRLNRRLDIGVQFGDRYSEIH
jgi:hypothetical protein